METSLTILTIGDPHFKVSNMVDTSLMTQAIFKVALDLRPTGIVVLGDVLDRHETIHVAPLTAATKFLKGLASIAPLYVLIGNHDRPNNSDFLSEQHPFVGLKDWPGIEIIDATKTSSLGGKSFVFVPYVPPGRFVEALDKVTNWKSAAAIFAHQEFKGAQMGAIKSLEGDEWPLDAPYVISGHIHDFHQLQPNVLYTGTPMQHAFGDRDDKTVTLVTFDASDRLVHRQISLGLPRRLIVHLSPSQVELYQPPQGALVKLVIEGTMAELKTVAKLERIRQLTKEGVKIAYKEKAEPLSLLLPARSTISFTEALYTAVKDDTDLAPLVTELFGDLGPKTPKKSPMKLVIRT